MKNRFYAAAAVGSGLFAAEVIASIHIFLTNQWLFKKISVLSSTGYLTLPNAITAPTLTTLSPAIFGGLFFTFTVGAGLSVATFFAIWAWGRLFSRSKAILTILAIIWVALVAWIGFNGFSPAALAYTVFIPLIVSAVTIRGIAVENNVPFGKTFILHALAVFIPALFLINMMDEGLFSNVRDQILLSNNPGITVSNFYYKYTLYPAEAFKSLHQKSLKTVYLEDIKNDWLWEKIEGQLRREDYLLINDVNASDLVIEKRNNQLFLKNGKTVIIKIASSAFLAEPHRYLQLFSDRIDKNRGLRRLTFYGLLAGFPLFLYLLLFTMTAAMFDFFMARHHAATASICLCLFTALVVLFMLYRSGTNNLTDIENALRSPKTAKRAAALRKISIDRLEIASFTGYNPTVERPSISERYWLARSMGYSKKPATYPVLLNFLNDSNPIVVCQALRSLGERKKRSAIVMIVQKLKTTSHWYIQWYAYRSLRNLGWIQKKSI